jgi:hypothetical protein
VQRLLLSLSVLLLLGATRPPSQVARLLAADGSEVPGPVAVSGRVLVVAGNGLGHVFVEPDGGWAGDVVAVATLRASGGAYLVSAAVSGGTAVLGAFMEDDFTGAAYVFSEPAGGWAGELREAARLGASDPAPWTLFGVDVAVADDVVVVAAPDAEVEPGRHGAAYVYERPRRGWAGSLTEQARLRPLNPQRTSYEDGSFFHSVAMSGDAIFAAANYEGAHHGAVYVFVRPPDGWGGTHFEAARITSSDNRREDHFGQSIAADGHTLAVVAKGYEREDEPAATYVFSEPSGGWAAADVEQARLYRADGHSFDDVAISRDTIVATAPQVEVSPTVRGALYAFSEPSQGWLGLLSEPALLLSERISWSGPVVFGDRVASGGAVFELGFDADRDLLSDALEAKLGTDPSEPDGDGDGIPDGSDPGWLAARVTSLPVRALRSPGSRRALLAGLENAERRLAAADAKRAHGALDRLRLRLDGCEPAADKNDWIVACATQREVRGLLDVLRENLDR